MNKGNKGHCQLVIAGGNPAKDFQFVEKALYQMSLFVDIKVTVPRIGTVTPRGYGKDSVLFRNIISDLLCAIGFVTENITAGNLDTRK